MFKVFISAKSLERLCINEMSKNNAEQNSWFVLLTKQDIIYLDKNIYNEIDYNDPLFIFSESYNINFKTSDINYNEVVKNTPELVLNEPNSAFLLDIDKDSASSIQGKYGIICQSTEDLSDCSLAYQGCKFSLIKNECVHSWKELFENGVAVPSNALIIIDRYIFGYENKHKSRYYDGTNNIKQIIESVLPDSLDCDYHVLILFDINGCTDNDFNLDKVSMGLNRFCKSLGKPYNIIIELYSITNKCSNYDATHDRRFISNYFIGSASHLIKAFRSGIVICDQDISVESAYSHGLFDKSDSAVKRMNNLYKQLQNMHKDGLSEFANKSENAGEYMVICETNKASTIADVKNRLIVRNDCTDSI